jgi:two-component system chemotaxis response regulator CheB
VVEAAAGQRLQSGHAYIAPGHLHLELDSQLRVVLNTDPPVKHCRPSVDVLFHCVARQCSAEALGVILTGMGDDGADGALAMKKAGAQVIAQDEESSLVYGMPRAAFEAGATTRVLSLEKIKTLLADVAHQRAAEDKKAQL